MRTSQQEWVEHEHITSDKHTQGVGEGFNLFKIKFWISREESSRFVQELFRIGKQTHLQQAERKDKQLRLLCVCFSFGLNSLKHARTLWEGDRSLQQLMQLRDKKRLNWENNDGLSTGIGSSMWPKWPGQLTCLFPHVPHLRFTCDGNGEFASDCIGNYGSGNGVVMGNGGRWNVRCFCAR